ncbi:hypothetical protein DVT68_08780 [Dyella solisilvae]|uniref:Glycosyltransferase RgtA/B/C/D-like domain-containing protein n=2 Tax=Dyella solisilvae TaxID=1920168 RepID=A0A370K996_9GAMM|nr:hypothetical protein DVT68_08780 [Dyella solisilvae]
MLGLCLAFGATVSVALGQDISWDAKNYHLYNAWAFLHGRTQDLAAAGMQSYFNPLPDVPYFWLAQGPLQHWPRLLAALQGLWFGALVFLVFRIAAQLAHLQGRRFDMADACAAVIGATGSMAVSQAGSTTNEVPLAVLLLLGLYLLMPLMAEPGRSGSWRRALVAGLCSGLAAGLKPTAIVFPPAMALALLLALGVRQGSAWRVTATYAAGAAFAFLVSYGPWGWHLYAQTENPVFPLFNQFFHSPLTAATGGTDGQFRPRNAMQWLFYPFYWMGKQRGIVTEPVFADPRYALAMVAMISLAVAHWLRREGVDRGLRFLMVFVGAGYILWMGLFSILRYAIPLEALTGILMLAAIRAWWPRRWRQSWTVPAVSTALLLAILATTTYPSWWRSPYAHRIFDVTVAPVEPGSLVIFAGSPDAYLAPMFPNADQLSFVGLTWFVRASQGHGLWDMVQQRLRTHDGPRYVVLRDDQSNAPEAALLETMLPGYSAEGCHNIDSNLERGRRDKNYAMGLRLCRLATK